MWGAATHDLATGVHRPLTTTALALQSAAGGRPRLLVALDIALLGDLGGASDAERVLGPVREALSLEPGELLVNCSHTHAAPWAAMSRSHNPGGELIGPYLDQLSTGDPRGGARGDRRSRARDADLGHGTLRPRPQPGSPGSGERERPLHLRLQSHCGGGRHARSGTRDRGRRRSRAGHDRQLRLPPDDARVGQHAHLPGLHRGDARARRVADGRRSVRLPPGSLGRARARAPVRR